MDIRPAAGKVNLGPPALATAPLAELVDPEPLDAYRRALSDVYLYNKYRPQDATSLAELQQSPELSKSDLDCLNELPALSADGLTRTSIHYQSPAALKAACAARGWEATADGTPLVDVAVVGAGPGGISTAYHLAQQGVRVVTLEAGYTAQAFSDAGAASVHSMRTDRLLTSLVRTGHALEDLSTVMGLPGELGQIVAHAAAGRHALGERTGHRISGLAEGVETLDRYQPATRGELFEHYQELGNYLADGCDNSFLLEKAPVSQIRREEGLFTIETGPGHRLKARKLVMATGLVQPGGSNATMLPVLQNLAEQNPERYLMLGQDRDLQTHARELDGSRQLIVTDRLLGRPDVKLALQQLPGQARVAVVGSGESALKAALEVLSQNPTLKVDLFVKAPLEAAQVQVPGENFHPVVLERAPDRPDYGTQSLERFQKFGTPVTPRSMIEALDEVAAGRMRIHEMGAYFDEATVSLQPDGDQATRIGFPSPEVKANLAQQRQEWAARGLRQPDGDIGNVQMIIQAAGYERDALPLNPLAQQLRQQGLVDWDGRHARLDGLMSATCPDLAFNSSMVLGTVADSALPGMAVRGRKLAEHLAEGLEARPRPPQAAPPERVGADWAKGYSEADFEGFVKYRGLAPNWAESQTGPHDTPQFTFPDPERFLRELSERDPATLRPAEKITLERARSLVERMGTPKARE